MREPPRGQPPPPAAPPSRFQRRRRLSSAVGLSALLALHISSASGRYLSSTHQRQPTAVPCFVTPLSTGHSLRYEGWLGSSPMWMSKDDGPRGARDQGNGRGGRSRNGGGGSGSSSSSQGPRGGKGVGGGRGGNRGGARGGGSGGMVGGGPERLNKVLAHAGVSSRRGVETLISQGRVTVNGVKVEEVGAKVDARKDKVCVDGKQVDLKASTAAGVGEAVWVAFNKPKGVVTTTTGDEKGRKTVDQMVPLAKEKRLAPVGRLDRETSGLVLLTNDYDASHLLSQPAFGHVKEYQLVVQNGLPKLSVLEALADGDITITDDRQQQQQGGVRKGGNKVVRKMRMPMEVEVLDYFTQRKETVLRVMVRDASSQLIRRALEQAEHPVKSMKRTAFGSVKLGRLGLGEWRKLSLAEVSKIKTVVSAHRRRVDRKERRQGRISGTSPATSSSEGGKAAGGGKGRGAEGAAGGGGGDDVEDDDEIKAFWDAVEDEEDDYDYDEDDYHGDEEE